MRRSLHSLEVVCDVDLSYIDPQLLVDGRERHVLYAMQIVRRQHSDHERAMRLYATTLRPLTSSYFCPCMWQLDAVCRSVARRRDAGSEEVRVASRASRASRGKQQERAGQPDRQDGRGSTDAMIERRSHDQPLSYERQQVDSGSHDSLLRAVDYMQQFITQARHATLTDEQHAQQATDGGGKEERSEKEEDVQEKEAQSQPQVDDDEQGDLRRIMHELANRPELLRWAAEQGRLEESGMHDESERLHEGPTAGTSRLLPLATRMREESELFASRRRPLLSSSSLAPSAASSHSSFSLLSAAERRLCSRRLSSLQRQLADEARQRRATQHTLQARMAEEERRRAATLKRVESAAVERAMAAAMGRNRRDERELERRVAEQADRVRELIGMKRDGMRQYYREQLGLVQEVMDEQEKERAVQEKVAAHSNTANRNTAATQRRLLCCWLVSRAHRLCLCVCGCCQALQHALRRGEREERESRASNLDKLQYFAAQLDHRASLHAQQNTSGQGDSKQWRHSVGT